MIKPAIVAVGYNRPEGISRLLDSIGKANYKVDNIPLIISIDESDKSDEVEKVAQDFVWSHGPKIIRRFPERQGLRKHIIQCGDYSEIYGGVIILEDDLIVAEDFYSFVCTAHEKYSKNEKICGIALYSYSYNVFTHYTFLPTPSIYDAYMGGMVVTWGQSWTHQQWLAFKQWYLKHDNNLPEMNPQIPMDISGWTRSWGRYFASYMAENDLRYIYPYVSRTTCFSDYGEHNKSGIPLTFVQVPLMQGSPDNYSFCNIEFLEEFDPFYERVLKHDEIIAGIPGDSICMDLNNMKTITGGKKYVITNQILPYHEIISFGLTVRPIAMNVLSCIPGDQLHLYELKNDFIRQWSSNRPKYPVSLRRLKYEFHDISWRLLIYYAPKEFFTRLKDYIIQK